MSKKKIIGVIIILLICLVAGLGSYYYFGNQDEKSTLTIAEKKWIDKNKNSVIDIGIVNDIPVFNLEGVGVVFDFLKDIETDTKLEFNRIPYEYDKKSKTDYSFKFKSKLEDNDILIYEDNYAIVSKSSEFVKSLDKISKITLGVTKEDKENINFYLYDNKNINYKTFDTTKELFDELNAKNSSINAIAIPKTLNINNIITNKLNINYDISDYKLNLVLTLGKERKLNNIIKKYLNKWQKEKYQKSFNKHFQDNYFKSSNVSEDSVAEFRRKQYTYGFISYAPFTTPNSSKLVGISSEYLERFAKLSDIEIKYKSYKSLYDLIKDFNANKIDFFLNVASDNKYTTDIIETRSISDGNIVIAANEKNSIVVNSLSSLKDKEVLTVAGSKIATYLKGYGVKTIEVNNFEDIIKESNNNSIIAIDAKAFELYKYNDLKNFKVFYNFSLDSNYDYIISNIKENRIFANFFNFYISFENGKKLENNVTHDMYTKNIKTNLVKYLGITLACIIILILLMATIIKKPFKRKSKSGVSKENKLKYIDMLTSLKNRNFLNDSIEKWDTSEIYPQSIIIVNLNNIAYINDNYGHEEGDSVIVQAANVLITTQIENSEIMRTNGDEFLIYMVEHDEKEVVTYIRKLSRDFKELTHGFGAAIGYSMITDGLKTVDDAINEATLDMKSNKEEINN